ncbi:hypothetical protein EJK42_21650, partial [Shigella dysenteriae]|nr:hypothetical protein [Shigella dysenteriae]
KNTSFFELANNLFNKLDALDGYAIVDGAEQPSESETYCVSGFIRVEPETSYTMAKVTRLTMYDKDKKYVGRVNGGGGDFTNLTTHSLAIYVRLTVSISNKYIAQLNEGNTLLPYDTGVFLQEQYIKTNIGANSYDMARHAQIFTIDHVEGGVPTTHSEVYALFDNLMDGNESYVSKHVLGQDSLGNDIVSYEFKMADIDTQMISNPFKRLKIGILTGLHGDEKNTMVGALEFLKNVTENPNKNEMISKLRSMADLFILPVGNPSGWDANTRDNHNLINLNRDFTEQSQLETQIIMNWMRSNSLDYVIDYHNTSTTAERITWVSGSPESQAEMATHYWKAISELSSLWSGRFPEFPDNVIFGSIHGDSSISATKNGAASLGIKGCTLETGWYIGFTGDGWNSITSNIVSSELIGNMVLQIFKEYNF